MGVYRSAIRIVLAGALHALLVCGPVRAQDVTLTSRDGSVEITGTLLGYDGEFYRVDSEFGVLTLDGSGVVCQGPGCPDLDTFVAEIDISGSRVMGRRLLPELIARFAQREDYTFAREDSDTGTITIRLSGRKTGRAAARFTIFPGSSSEGFADLLAERADMVLSRRPVSPVEVSRGIDAGLGRFTAPGRARVIALDALVPIVSPRNSVQQISLGDLARVYAGRITSWKALGGIDAPIDLYLPQAQSALSSVFADRVMTPEGLALSPGVRRFPDTASLAKAVAANPFAIGMTTFSEVGATRLLTLTGGCGFRASVTPETLKSEDYPLGVPLFLYLRGGRLPAVGREFVRFLDTPAAQIAILRAGFVDQALSRTPVSRQGVRLANAIRAAGEEVKLDELKRLVTAMDGARRLSVTFRFERGATTLNAQSRSNVALLAHSLERRTLGARELTFVGFSDGIGPAQANRKLSRQRANAVRAAVLRAATTLDPDSVTLKVDGFGEAMPMACDDTGWGREINRRVEVWVR